MLIQTKVSMHVECCTLLRRKKDKKEFAYREEEIPDCGCIYG